MSPEAARGLTAEEARVRLAADGPNELPPPATVAAWRHLFAQMTHFFAAFLWAAGALAIVARMPQLGIAIFAVVVINGVFAFAQEHRAERAAHELRTLLPRRVTVVRDGRTFECDAAELVLGDLVQLAAGDRISADLRVVEAHALAVDTSAMTGESVPVTPAAGEDAFAGTFVTSGEGAGVVTATGSRTRIAGIAQLTTGTRRQPTPLARELNRVVRIVAGVSLGVGLFFFVIALLVGTSERDGFLFAIGVTVALVPEGLLPTVTLSLAIGAQRMARRNALVRRLEAVETLGSATFVCTDKTGTLTMNQVSVVAVWTPAGEVSIAARGYDPAGGIEAEGATRAALERLATAACRASTGRAVEVNGRWEPRGDPMEAALHVLGLRIGVDIDALEAAEPAVARFPFDAERKRMAVATGAAVYVKGAPERVLPLCTAVEGATEAVARLAERGLRVLAVASRTSRERPGTAEEAERGLELLGLAAFEDPPRPEAKAAIAACRAAGVKVAMVTGDHAATALAIAREVGLAVEGSMVVEGADLPADGQLLGALVDRDGLVVTRVSPEDKLRIARALRGRGHVVAMTGDGVNDGPALHEADIGVAMGRSGTDVAREAADLVLLDDNFATIVAAIEEGRATFANIRRFLTYHLTDNVAELTPFVVWALSGGRFPLAIGVLQVLCLDIGTDLTPALALGAERPTERSVRRPLAGRHLIDRKVLTRVFGVLGPVEAVMEMAAFVAVMLAAGWRPGEGFPGGHVLLQASGAAFTAVVLGQLANAFACRSTTVWPGALGWGTNRGLLAAVAIEAMLLVVFLFVGPLAELLGHAPPTLPGLAMAALGAPAVLGADALQKWLRRRPRVGT
ncbi:MAG: cation-transporting P-type ATPase [Dehalococcoidia bacterium]